MPAEKRQSKKAQSLTSSLSVGFPVFVGWGKERAGAVATTLARWLGRVVQQTEAHVSGDIVLGKRWNEELNALLDGAHYAVLVTTREAMLQPWFLFEAGRLSRHGQPAVPYLVDLKPTDLPEPLGQLQATRADEAGTFRLVDSLNALTLKPLQQDDLRQVFAGAWPELHAELEKARKAPLPAPPPRSDGEKLDELLNLVRELRRINDSENRREQVLHELAATIRVSSKAAGTLSSDDPDPLVFQRTLSFLRHLNAQQQLAAVAAVLKKKDEE